MLKSLFLSLLFCIAGKVAMCQTNLADLKAAFIYNFTNYVEWENTENEKEFTIGIIGLSGIETPLSLIAKTKTIKNKKIVIRHFSKPEEINRCQVLFISQNCPFSLPSILEKTDKSVLTISEEPGFAKQGTAFNFVPVNDKLKFEANLKTIISANFKVSSQLLKLAIIIN